ncbi:hypothetical protein HBI56_224960 [Parastagonospora nodorum]|uniref:Uncharacterized protein n=2 Tax=Phaeosphaeria nodorum (strain SN15 / ATCC MYA-4574 / FGSC 10173) TaxID=321614 RepID=A0A7U2ID62_PHANO|nr:hypothetical protein SNOG_16327 [Parastagonospora nodorum SN15]KAH3914721.1 hypothetical protein HBH56_093260 [Parastagonospora nodorum]EAT76313.1 hypothetical protein SNOG_16327 [Parastagonospora nodorum SN15]KAH3921607.1 hypothetical protein HBH54_237430 [Parastagonospora nodorum]KAH3957892.1 hypothetical protein HBH51_217900 [Parastagonospora nodorum]KAH3967400.1 hypothetical protein HBH52_187130 [Parastagonospora nodorum]
MLTLACRLYQFHDSSKHPQPGDKSPKTVLAAVDVTSPSLSPDDRAPIELSFECDF